MKQNISSNSDLYVKQNITTQKGARSICGYQEMFNTNYVQHTVSMKRSLKYSLHLICKPKVMTKLDVTDSLSQNQSFFIKIKTTKCQKCFLLTYDKHCSQLTYFYMTKVSSFNFSCSYQNFITGFGFKSSKLQY